MGNGWQTASNGCLRRELGCAKCNILLGLRVVPGKDPKEEDEAWLSMPSGEAGRLMLRRFLPRICHP
jgi:hypothetical protein